MENYFLNDEIDRILRDTRVSNYKKTTLDIKTKELFKYLISKNFDVNSIKKMILNYPRLLTFSIELIEDRYNNLKSIFNKNINNTIVLNPRILSRSKEEINWYIDYFISKGLTKEEAIKVCLKCPILMNISALNLNTSMSNLKDKIVDDKKIIELIVKTPRILLFSLENITDKFNWFYIKEYTKEQTSKIICKANTILTKEFITKDGTDSDMDIKYKYLYECFGYTKEQIIYITYSFPEYFTLSIDTIKNRISNLYRLGFDDNAVNVLFYKFPQIISFKESSLNEKYNYYFELDMLELFIKSPKYLMQRLELTDARYKYLINKGIEVNKNNCSKLFLSSKKFRESYGIDNEELLNKYKEKEGYYEQGTNKRDTIKYRKRIKEC